MYVHFLQIIKHESRSTVTNAFYIRWFKYFNNVLISNVVLSLLPLIAPKVIRNKVMYQHLTFLLSKDLRAYIKVNNKEMKYIHECSTKSDVTWCKILTQMAHKPHHHLYQKKELHSKINNAIKHLNHHDLPVLVIAHLHTQPRCTVVC